MDEAKLVKRLERFSRFEDFDVAPNYGSLAVAAAVSAAALLDHGRRLHVAQRSEEHERAMQQGLRHLAAEHAGDDMPLVELRRALSGEICVPVPPQLFDVRVSAWTRGYVRDVKGTTMVAFPECEEERGEE